MAAKWFFFAPKRFVHTRLATMEAQQVFLDFYSKHGGYWIDAQSTGLSKRVALQYGIAKYDFRQESGAKSSTHLAIA
ncbi:MAG TPA: hypothetical protein PLS10_13270 [Chitinophagales bacterium]|nr:hypothetical protein [Chitinophagales bacterium]